MSRISYCLTFRPIFSSGRLLANMMMMRMFYKANAIIKIEIEFRYIYREKLL